MCPPGTVEDGQHVAQREDYWDYQEEGMAGRPGFRPDLVPTNVITVLTSYVPRLRDLLRSVDHHRTGKVRASLEIPNALLSARVE